MPAQEFMSRNSLSIYLFVVHTVTDGLYAAPEIREEFDYSELGPDYSIGHDPHRRGPGL
jgi:hypothetical protein